ncbi:aldo/keto reductase [Candidatus Saccharibacteria bacterium]|nr:aldo/keto reductase [Candidatus Saccharibacteria bacterium]
MNNLPKLALGTWLMGGAKNVDPSNDDQSDISVIRLALDNGINLIDTAQNYAAGRCEELVGRAVKSYPRGSYRILTKQTKDDLSYQGVIDGCKMSLKRLGVDYIDYFVCHAPSTDFDMHEFFKATNKLYKDGLIRHVGVSNFGPKTLQIALEASDLPISLNQVSFSLNDGSILSTGTYKFCVKNNIPIQAFRTLAGLEDNRETITILEAISPKYNLTIQQLVIAYINSYENMHFTIRASNKEHWQDIRDALNIKLEMDDITILKDLHSKRKSVFSKFLEI